MTGSSRLSSWWCADFAAYIFIPVFDFFVPPVRPRRFGYFSRTHFAAISDTCQVPFGIKLYQRILK